MSVTRIDMVQGVNGPTVYQWKTADKVCEFGLYVTNSLQVVEVARTLLGPMRVIRKGTGAIQRPLDTDLTYYGPIAPPPEQKAAEKKTRKPRKKAAVSPDIGAEAGTDPALPAAKEEKAPF